MPWLQDKTMAQTRTVASFMDSEMWNKYDTMKTSMLLKSYHSVMNPILPRNALGAWSDEQRWASIWQLCVHVEDNSHLW